MLARPDIDAVIVGVPDHWHALIVVAAARNGKDIYCEKPLSLTIEQGKRMRDAVQRYGRVLQTGSQSRSKRNTRHAGELVQNGRIGRLKSVKVGLPKSPYFPTQPVMEVPKGFDYDFWLGPAPWAPYTEKRCHIHQQWILDYSDGMIADWDAHQLDLAQWAMGVQESGPIWVEGTGKFPRDGLTDVATEFQFKCGYAHGLVLQCSTDFEGGVKFEETEGWVQSGHGGFFRSEPESLVNEVIGPNEIHLYDNPDHHRNFLDCVRFAWRADRAGKRATSKSCASSQTQPTSRVQGIEHASDRQANAPGTVQYEAGAGASTPKVWTFGALPMPEVSLESTLRRYETSFLMWRGWLWRFVNHAPVLQH
jgi:predicted dehydrogenase